MDATEIMPDVDGSGEGENEGENGSDTSTVVGSGANRRLGVDVGVHVPRDRAYRRD
jgi:hypothetical protein